VGEREVDVSGNEAIISCMSYPLFYKNVISSELVQPGFFSYRNYIFGKR
jgi:hypothetical protein